MIDRKKAKETVESAINPGKSRKSYDVLVIDSKTIEKKWGWVFFYTSQEWVESGNIEFAVIGHAPVFVVKKTGEVIFTGTAYPVEHYITCFEATGNPFG